MAVAVQPATDTKKPTQPMGLIAASVIGAVAVLVGLFIVLRGIPWVWDQYIHAALTKATNSFVSTALLIIIQVAAAILFVYAWAKLGAGKQVPGFKGGVFFVIATAAVAFFCVNAIVKHLPRGFTFANVVVLLFNVTILFLLVQFYRTGRFTDWSLALDHGGWFDAKSYKRTQGLRVRRLTILGILAVAFSGIWTMSPMHHNYLPSSTDVRLADGSTVNNRMGDWVVGGTTYELLPIPTIPATASEDERKQLEKKREEVRLENRGRPRVEGGITLLPDLQFTIPLVLIAASLWFAWRVVNYPQFADFLIATEAEINKVSWTSRRALVRDTIVVLTSLILLTVFLFVVDVFWGWLLSRERVGVLPTRAERDAAGLTREAQQQDQEVTDW